MVFSPRGRTWGGLVPNLVPRPMYEKNDNKFVRAEQCAAQPSSWVGKINMNCIKIA